MSTRKTTDPLEGKKICIVTDWITSMGGVARVDLALHKAFPDAPIYTSVYSPENLGAMNEYASADIRTTWLQKLPGPLRKLHKLFPTLRVRAFRKLDLSEFDVIISSSSAESKQVQKTRPGQIHICYCHTPIRYYWSHYDEYRKNPGVGKLDPVIRLLAPILIPSQRKADYTAAQNVDFFVANSTEVKKRIKKYYNRNSTVIFPPVDTARFNKCASRKSRHGFIAVGRQVPYKRIDLAVAAANKLQVELHIYGNGPEHEKLVLAAGPTVKFHVGASDDEIANAFCSARAFIFPAEEDFGIVQVEALAAGCPVIAFGEGGARDIVTSKTGEFFDEQTVDSLTRAMKTVEQKKYRTSDLTQRAATYDESVFIHKIRTLVADKVRNNR